MSSSKDLSTTLSKEEDEGIYPGGYSSAIELVPISIQFCKKKKKKQKVDHYQIWVKSSFDSQTKVGSWCWISFDDKKNIITMTGREENTDKNKILLIPVWESLDWLKDDIIEEKKEDEEEIIERVKHITIFTTSNYLYSSVGEWIDKWKKTNFIIPKKSVLEDKVDDEVEDNKLRPNADILIKIDQIKQSLTLVMKFLMKDDEFSVKAEEMCEKNL